MFKSYEPGNKKNILLVAITRMGDLLQASPTIVGLKRENPEAKITILVEREFATICRGIPGIDEIYELDLAMVCRCLHRDGDSLVDAMEYVEKIVDDLKSRQFDYCLNMASSGYTAILLKLLEVEDCRGWIADDEGTRLIVSPWSMLFAAFVFHSNRDYNSLNLVDIFRCSAGVRAHPHRLMYNVTDEAREFVREFIDEQFTGSDGPLICLQAGASQGKRQWAPSRFAHLVRLLVEELGARVVLTGSKSEENITEAILQEYQSERVVSAVGRTNLAQLGALLELADVLVTGDTGPMHMAVAVGTPVVALFLASALCFETGPYSEGNFVLQPQVSCNPCNPNYPCSRPDCHDQISPELVYMLTKLRLETPMGAEASLRISREVAHPDQVVLYRTAFDQDGFLEFVPMNGTGARKGRSALFFDAARAAYRRVWKEDLNGADTRPMPELGSFRGRTLALADDSIELTLRGTTELASLAAQGMALMDELDCLIKDIHSPVHRLGEINQEVSALDRNIENLGLGYPALGALSRMFIMEKENIRGEDPLRLASETRGLYRTLKHRTEKFGHLFAWEVQRTGESHDTGYTQRPTV